MECLLCTTCRLDARGSEAESPGVGKKDFPFKGQILNQGCGSIEEGLADSS